MSSDWGSDHISVPSSSGTRVQPERRRGTDPGLGQFQSPLHRGHAFNKSPRAFATFCLQRFQSPLHRGHAFNPGPAPRASAAQIHFSPLFIGDTRSTTAAHGAGAEQSVFQSPLHRGHAFNANRSAAATASACPISVPSSSGTRVQRDPASGARGLRVAISVPSSSGTRVQPPSL